MTDLQMLGLGLGGIGAMWALLLAVRATVLWYWRISEIVEVLHSIDDSLHHLPAVQDWRARQIAAKRRSA